MRLTKLLLTNFKSFKSTQAINLAPITLMFGPNSTGKSAVISALNYANHILETGDCSPYRFSQDAGKVIGGFKELVNGKNDENEIKLGFELTGFMNDLPIDTKRDNNLYEKVGFKMPFYRGAKSVRLEFTIGKANYNLNGIPAVVKRFEVWFDEKFMGAISLDVESNICGVTELNLNHSLHENYTIRNGIKDCPLNDHFTVKSLFNRLEQDKRLDFGRGEFESFCSLNTKFDRHRVKLIQIERFASNALVDPKNPIKLMYRHEHENSVDEAIELRFLEDVLSSIFVLPLNSLLEVLKASAAIGPLRFIPDESFTAHPYVEQSQWYDGSTAWNILSRPYQFSKTQNILDVINDWMCRVDRFNLGYKLKLESLRGYSSDIEKSSFLVKKAAERYLVLEDINNSVTLSPDQLGTGISQLLPIIVASLDYKTVSMLSIEQPELHIHPRIQSAMAELFIENKSLNHFLIETHSEHLILRMLRRIRETSEGKYVDPIEKLFPDDLSINYLLSSENGVIVNQIRVDEEGDFIDRWPHGFFSERLEEY